MRTLQSLIVSRFRDVRSLADRPTGSFLSSFRQDQHDRQGDFRDSHSGIVPKELPDLTLAMTRWSRDTGGLTVRAPTGARRRLVARNAFTARRLKRPLHGLLARCAYPLSVSRREPAAGQFLCILFIL